MTAFRFKPVVSAGFSALLAGVALGSLPALAQNYIDVEAEREAARSNGQRTEQQEVPVYSSSQTSSQPVEVTQPVPQSTGGAYSGASSTPNSYDNGYDSGYDGGYDGSYGGSGIKPYSGQTTLATPTQTGGASGYSSRVATPAGTTSASGAADVGSLVVQLQQLQEEVRRLNGIVEEQTAQIQQLKEQSLERYVDLDRRLAGIGADGAGPVAGIGSGATSVAPGPTAGASVGTTPVSQNTAQAQPGEEAAYQSAYDFVKRRNFDRAVTAFKAFLGEYPFGRYAPNAHYWLGELYLVIDPPDPELARQSFKLLLDQYPNNPKVPDALYKLGKVQYLKGNRDRSREYLERVIKEYPGHPAAQLAQDFIKENF